MRARTINESKNYLDLAQSIFLDNGFDENSKEYKNFFGRYEKYSSEPFFMNFVKWIFDENIKHYGQNTPISKIRALRLLIKDIERSFPEKFSMLQYSDEWNDIERLLDYMANRDGYITLGGSSDMFSGREEPIYFDDDKNLIELFTKHGVVDEEGRVGYMLDGKTVRTFPVKQYVNFMLDSMHQNGQNNFYGKEDDLYPFIDKHGFIGWISADSRRNTKKNMEEAKKRLKKSFS